MMNMRISTLGLALSSQVANNNQPHTITDRGIASLGCTHLVACRLSNLSKLRFPNFFTLFPVLLFVQHFAVHDTVINMTTHNTFLEYKMAKFWSGRFCIYFHTKPSKHCIRWLSLPARTFCQGYDKFNKVHCQGRSINVPPNRLQRVITN